MARESRRALVARAHAIDDALAALYPEARCELDFVDPFQLLVATVLSAQSTDRRVNAITPLLFADYPDADAMASANVEDIEELIRPVGFYRTKASALVGISQALVERYGGQVPGSLDDLVTLPGVGRKTANVVLGNAFGVPGITPDTHFIRLANRFKWVASTNPDVVEATVGALFEPERWVMLCHHVIWHGRRRCHARRPACGACPLAELCPSYGEGPTDAATAATLVREPRA